MRRKYFFVLIVLLSVFACKKDNTNTKGGSASTFNIQFQITGFPACYTNQGIKVCLYKTYNDYYSNQNIVATGITDANGQCVFSNIPVYNYYYKFSIQCGGIIGGNSSNNIQLTGSISPGITYVQDVAMGYL